MILTKKSYLHSDLHRTGPGIEKYSVSRIENMINKNKQNNVTQYCSYYETRTIIHEH